MLVAHSECWPRIHTSLLPSCSYMKVCLGGPTPADYEALLAEREMLKRELSDARQQLEELRQQVRRRLWACQYWSPPRVTSHDSAAAHPAAHGVPCAGLHYRFKHLAVNDSMGRQLRQSARAENFADDSSTVRLHTYMPLAAGAADPVFTSSSLAPVYLMVGNREACRMCCGAEPPTAEARQWPHMRILGVARAGHNLHASARGHPAPQPSAKCMPSSCFVNESYTKNSSGATEGRGLSSGD